MKYDVYISQDGTVYKIGDTVRIGIPSSNKTFAYIYYTKGALSDKMSYLAGTYSGTKTKIYRISIGGNKRTGYASIFTKIVL